jgi:antitoxin (DNA-binding transcriptional repressor) of toxin-antitoxin stability system
MSHMSSPASIRELRNDFTTVRKRLEAEGEVLVTDRGKPRYRLSVYMPPPEKPASRVDYWARLSAYQPRPLTKAQSRKLHADNRGER